MPPPLLMVGRQQPRWWWWRGSSGSARSTTLGGVAVVVALLVSLCFIGSRFTGTQLGGCSTLAALASSGNKLSYSLCSSFVPKTNKRKENSLYCSQKMCSSLLYVRRWKYIEILVVFFPSLFCCPELHACTLCECTCSLLIITGENEEDPTDVVEAHESALLFCSTVSLF